MDTYLRQFVCGQTTAKLNGVRLLK